MLILKASFDLKFIIELIKIKINCLSLDINECLEEPCPENSTCLNYLGSFKCDYDPGFTRYGLNCEGMKNNDKYVF